QHPPALRDAQQLHVHPPPRGRRRGEPGGLDLPRRRLGPRGGHVPDGGHRPGRARTGLPADPVALLQWSAGRPHLLKALPSRTATGRQAGRGPLEWGGRTAHLRFGSTGRDCPRTSGVVRRSLTSSGRALPSPDSPPFDEARVGHGVSQAPATTTPDERAEPAAAGARADPRLPRPRPRGGGARLPPPLLPAP